jgi:signal transduction histidine kinase
MTAPRRADVLTRRLLFSLGGAAVMFVLTVAVSQISASGIRSAARGVSENASPSVATLAEARTGMRHLEVVLDDFVDRSSETPASRVDRARFALNESWREYQALPVFPDEKQKRGPVNIALDLVNRDVDATMSAPPEKAQGLLLQAKRHFDLLDGELQDLQRFNSDEAMKLARYIEETWQRSLVLSLALLLLGVLLTAASGLAVIRLVRSTTALLEERAEELELFGSRIAHDLFNPLAATTMTLDVVVEKAAGTTYVAQLERARKTLRRVVELVEGLYAYARSGGHPEPGHAEVVTVMRAVAEQMRPSAEEQKIALVIEDPPSPCDVSCASGVLLSILQNLVDNALKHMGDRPQREVRVTAETNKHDVRIMVADTGTGIPRDQAARLFELYKRGETRATGLGLGLATVKRLVDSHGGTVWVESEVGVGSRFYVQLPRAS